MCRGSRAPSLRGWVHPVRFEAGGGDHGRSEIEGQDDPLPCTHATKEAAVASGRVKAMRRKTEDVIHNLDGTISERNSYGGNPTDRPG